MTIEKRPEPPSGLDAAVERIARVLEGECWGGGERRVQRVVIDSRQAGPGDLFVALPGERTNGHVFVQKALEQGAAGALVGRGWRPVPGCPLEGVICVPDPLLALGKLGAWRRNQFGGPVVGVTGSVGKTTTKDLLAAVLGRRGNVLKSTGNWNTEIGVPLTLLALNPSHGAAVIEMAMRGSGQIAYLAAMARPEIGVVTHIGSSHLELLGSRDAIAAAKAELLDYLPWQGTAVLPSHGPYGAFLRSRVPPGTGVIGFGDTRTDLLEPQVVGIPLGLSAPDDRSVPGQGWRTRFRAVEWAPNSLGMLVVAEEWEGVLPVLGSHNLRNGMAAAAVGRRLGLEWPEILAGLAEAEVSGRRAGIHPLRGRGLLVDDAYNASTPEAMEAALEVLDQLPGTRKIAVLADMLELGPASEAAHAEVGRAAARRDLRLITIGPRARGFARAAREAGLPPDQVAEWEDQEAGLAALWRVYEPGAVVLVKGSRGMALEGVVQAIQEREGAEW